MPSNDDIIQWMGSADETITYLGQELQLTAQVSNSTITKTDPIGTIRIRRNGSALTGLAIPTEGWQTIPDTNPTLEARADSHYPAGIIRIRAAATSIPTTEHTHPAGSWLAPDSLGANMTDAGTPYYPVGGRLEANNVARLRGRVNTTTSYTAGATIMTLPATLRPAADIFLNFRSGGSGSVQSFLMVFSTTGIVSFGANVTVAGTAWFQFDGITYTVTSS